MIYHVTMSDGTSHGIDAANAADAIQSALEQYRNLTVRKCWRGDGTAGISYEVPPHKALPLVTKLTKKRAAKEPQLF